MSMSAMSAGASGSAASMSGNEMDAALNDPNLFAGGDNLGPEDQSALGNGTNVTDRRLLVMNTSCGVNMYYIPTAQEYFEALGVTGYVMIGLAAIAVFVMLVVFIQELLYIIEKAHYTHKTASIAILGVYPAIGLATLTSMIFPQTIPIYEAATMILFAFALYMFFLLTLQYFGGEKGMLQHFSIEKLPMHGPPCCCWPCCMVCPDPSISKTNLKMTRVFVLQFPIMMVLLYLLIITLWIAGYYTPGKMFDMSDACPWLSTLVLLSTLTGLYGFIIMRNLSHKRLSDFHYMSKFVTLQLIIIFTRLQGLTFTIIGLAGHMPCMPPLSPMVFGQIVQQALSLGELVVLSIYCRNLYLQEIPAQLGPPRLGLMGPNNLIKRTSKPSPLLELQKQLIQLQFNENDKAPLTNNIANGNAPQMVITAPPKDQLEVPKPKT